jgi:hypothetical protein
MAAIANDKMSMHALQSCGPAACRWWFGLRGFETAPIHLIDSWNQAPFHHHQRHLLVASMGHNLYAIALLLSIFTKGRTEIGRLVWYPGAQCCWESFFMTDTQVMSSVVSKQSSHMDSGRCSPKRQTSTSLIAVPQQPFLHCGGVAWGSWSKVRGQNGLGAWMRVWLAPYVYTTVCNSKHNLYTSG